MTSASDPQDQAHLIDISSQKWVGKIPAPEPNWFQPPLAPFLNGPLTRVSPHAHAACDLEISGGGMETQKVEGLLKWETPSAATGRSLVHSGVGLFGGVGVSVLPILTPVSNLSLILWKPNKLTGSPCWTLVELYFGLWSVPYQG